MQNPNLRPELPGQSFDDDEPDLLDLIVVALESLKILILCPLLAGLLALGYTYTLPPVYTARTTMIPPAAQTGASTLLGQVGLGSLAGAVLSGEGVAPPGRHIAYLKSDVLRDLLIRELELQKRWGHSHLSQTREILKKSTSFFEDRKTGLLELSYSDADPKFAALVANSYVTALSRVLGEAAAVEARESRETLERQLTEAWKKSYQSSQVRDAVIQGLIQQAEASRMAENQRYPLITQIDKAEPPLFRSSPKRTLTAVMTSLSVAALCILFVFLRFLIVSNIRKPESAAKLDRIRRIFSR
jgi:uncharacterized protein involved in exopolysaccharide biosynthesis